MQVIRKYFLYNQYTQAELMIFGSVILVIHCKSRQALTQSL
jgi:hypothetical protein